MKLNQKLKASVSKLLALGIERDMRCGDGSSDNPISHSLNCRCDEINKEMREERNRIIHFSKQMGKPTYLLNKN